MRNIIRIFVSDVKRLATNVVAVVVIMGLSVIPSLYAWFNTMSNWDPYGEEATSNLNVVVASCDQGVEIKGVEINVGNMVVSNLKENKTIGWVFADSETEAVDKVYSGDCYAGLVIDEKFSQDLISFLGGDIENPKITYYENEKKNAIAPKITGKVKTTVQEEINSAFVSTIAQSLIQLSEYVVNTNQKGNITGDVINRLDTLNTDLTTYITIVDSYIGIIDSANSLMEATSMVSGQLDSMMEAGRSMANGADSAVDTASNSVDTVSDMVTKNLKDVEKQIVAMEKATNTLLSDVQKANMLTQQQVDSLKLTVSAVKTSFDSVTNGLKGKYPTTTVDADIAKVDTDFDNITADLDNISKNVGQTNIDVDNISKTLQKDFDDCTSSVQTLSKNYSNKVEPQLKTTMSSIENSISEVQQILNFSSDSIDDVSNALNSYPQMMSFGRDKLVKSRDDATAMQSKLNQLISDVGSIESNEQYNLIITLIQSDPQLIADFISSPVKLNQEAVFSMKNNGSAVAPFYIILSVWFGALILIAIIHSGFKSVDELKNPRNYQLFFGRYMVFFLIGQVQTIITVLGSLLYVGIQCEHPFFFWLATSISSFTFTLFLYSLAYAFGNVGEAAAVVLMVIQVAGSGGTFPVEVLPKIFQYMYKYMPFAHGMNAIRECIAGMHGNDYWVYLAGMLPYIAAALVLGLFVSIPCKKLNEKIEESKERTDLLL